MPGAHAVLSASGAHRWLVCTPSARLEEKYPEQTSPYAEEGTRAHALAEKTLKGYLAGGSPEVTGGDDEEMREAVQRYVDICIEKIGEARQASPDAITKVEERLDFSRWVPGGFGTGDMVLISDSWLEIVDLKYGKGVPVAAKNNPQMRLYALGMVARYGWLYGAEYVRMTIVQPRLDRVDTDTITVKDLLKWGAEAHGKAVLAFKGQGAYIPGDHCKFCRARFKCRARADAMEEAIRKQFIPPKELTPEDIVAILAKTKEVKTWLEDINNYALTQALGGVKWPGYKLVAGRSVRKITDPEAVGRILETTGEPDSKIYKKALLPLTQLEKTFGPDLFKDTLAKFIERPEGKPTLVPESDRRPELKTFDFKK